MLRKTKLLPIFGLLLIFLGCSNSNNSSTDDNNKTKLIKTYIIKKNMDKNRTIEETFLNEMGFNFKNQKIIIDLNKTKNFFSKMRNKMKEKVKQIEDINVSKNSGIIVTENKVDIDLNSTKNLLNSISTLFKDIVSDINSTIK